MIERSTSARRLCWPGALVLLASCRPPETRAVVGPEPTQPVVEYVSTQEILTPLPLHVWLPARYGAERVLVFFKTWGSQHWGSLELSRAGQTWAGEISCREVSTVTGDTRYYFLAVDADNRAVIGSGWPEWPHVATVVHKLPDGPRSLPGMAPPLRCHDPADCPPDFQGCPAYAVRRPSCREQRLSRRHAVRLGRILLAGEPDGRTWERRCRARHGSPRSASPATTGGVDLPRNLSMSGRRPAG